MARCTLIMTSTITIERLRLLNGVFQEGIKHEVLHQTIRMGCHFLKTGTPGCDTHHIKPLCGPWLCVGLCVRLKWCQFVKQYF